MKLLYALIIGVTFIGCRTGKTSSSSVSEDRQLESAIKRMDKDPANAELKKRLTNIYAASSKEHLEKMEVYRALTDESRWGKILKEYQSLHILSDLIKNSAVANTVLRAPDYNLEIQNTKLGGAESYYQAGIDDMKAGDRTSFRNAYYDLKKANEFIPGYKDVKKQMAIASENGTLRIVINPITDNTFYYSGAGFSNYGNLYSNDYFQRSLIRDLGGTSRNNGALFFSDYEAQRENIRPDWIVDLTWTDFYIPQPNTNQYSRTVSRRIENGRDTSGKSTYQTVYATLNIIKRYFNASGYMQLRVTDAYTRRVVADNRYSDQYNWQEEYATYNGDSRALSASEWALINNEHQVPQQQDILGQLYQRIYPQIKNRIYTLARW